ncbi:MAG: hypothetical protein LBO00_03925 [Zoogloeaceae bacterium]|jgi:hypothetical protein|nr:hypothetical protein [Zoogloeaceae bacterium]
MRQRLRATQGKPTARELTARIPLPATPEPLRLALSAVLEFSDGTIAYHALCHPAGKPDFHHATGFCLRFPGN